MGRRPLVFVQAARPRPHAAARRLILDPDVHSSPVTGHGLVRDWCARQDPGPVAGTGSFGGREAGCEHVGACCSVWDSYGTWSAASLCSRPVPRELTPAVVEALLPALMFYLDAQFPALCLDRFQSCPNTQDAATRSGDRTQVSTSLPPDAWSWNPLLAELLGAAARRVAQSILEVAQQRAWASGPAVWLVAGNASPSGARSAMARPRHHAGTVLCAGHGRVCFFRIEQRTSTGPIPTDPRAALTGPRRPDHPAPCRVPVLSTQASGIRPPEPSPAWYAQDVGSAGCYVA